MDAGRAVLITGAICLALALFLCLSPLAYPYGSMVGLGGTPGIMDRPVSISELPYALGDLLCHQDPERSIILNGNQMPICIRDVGILLGLSIGMVACGAKGFVPRSRVHLFIILALCSVTVIEWCMENYIQLPDVIRGVSGLVSGLGAGMVGTYAIHSVYEKG